MSIDKVVLVNLYYDVTRAGVFVEEGESNIGLKLIRDLLVEKGVDNVVLYPETPILVTELENDTWKTRYLKELHEIIQDEENTVLGFSVATDNYQLALDMANITRQELPKLKIVGGGPHFRRQEIVKDGTHYFDTVFMALMMKTENGANIFDAIFYGGADSFIKYVISDGKTDFPGIYTKNRDTGIGTKGKGKSSMPKVSSIPIRFKKVNDRWGEINLILQDTCPNMCGYCAIMKHNREIDVQAYADAVEEVSKEVNAVLIRVRDSCALKRDDLEPYESFFAELKRRKIRSVKGLYLDPQDFVAEERYRRRFDFLNRYGVHNLFFGRDCVDANVAKKIGRNYAYHNGEKCVRRVRTQEDLDNEKETLTWLIHDLKSERFNLDFLNMFVSYISTPFETYESQRIMIDEAEEFHNMTNGKYLITVEFFTLAPYPGTLVKRRFAHLIDNPILFGSHTAHWNNWSYDLGPQVYFMDAIFEVNRQFKSKEEKLPGYFDAMRKALDDAYEGRLQKKVWHERR